jgi:hypothetical protein
MSYASSSPVDFCDSPPPTPVTGVHLLPLSFNCIH